MYHSYTREMSTSTKTASDGSVFSVSYSASPGYYLLNYYYVEVYDDEGNLISTSSKGYYYGD